MDYPALKTEITTDPTSQGYGPYIAVGNLNEVETLINTMSAAVITLPQMTNSAFVAAFLSCLQNIFGLAAPKQSFYLTVWNSILAMPTIDFTNPAVGGLLAGAVADGVLTSAQATAINQRPGSRAEVLFGADALVSINDLSLALRS